MSATAIDGLSPLATDLQAQDPDRYLSTLFASSNLRPALFALYAFDHEIARIRHIVREPMAGLIRLQWWRDALDAIGKPWNTI
jgi:phytoene synthase